MSRGKRRQVEGKKANLRGRQRARRGKIWIWFAAVAAAVVVVLLTTDAWERLRVRNALDALPALDLVEAEPRVAERIRADRQAVLDAPLSAETWGALAGTFDAHGMLNEAETCYRQAGRLDRNDFRWPYLLAIVRDVNGAEAGEVEKLFHEALRLRPDYIQSWFRLGHALSLRGDHEGARHALELAVDAAPEMAPAHRELGQVLLALGEDEAALKSLERARDLAPDDGGVWVALTQAYMKAGRTEDARRAAARSEQLAGEDQDRIHDPVLARWVVARSVSTVQTLNRATARLQAGNARGALELLLPLVEERPDNAQTHYLLGAAGARLGRLDEADRALSRALELDPLHLGALLEKGALLESREDYGAAVEYYRRAVEIDPSDPPALLALAQGLARAGDDPGSIAALERLERVSTLDARTLMNWGNALRRSGDAAGAVRRHLQALELEPDFALAHFNLATAYETLGDRDRATQHFREALRLDPGLPAAEALARLGSP